MKLIGMEMLSRVDSRVRDRAKYYLDIPQFNDFDPIEFRKLVVEQMVGVYHAPIEGIASVEDMSIHLQDRDIPLRVYTPVGEGPFPLMVYFHGGGWIGGDLETHDRICRRCCAASQFVLVAVDYRLGPEAPFPAAPEDCYDATCWARDNAVRLNADAARLVVAGDSAGGNLATVVCLMSKDRNGPAIKHQVLIVPGLQQMSWYVRGYMKNDEDRNHPYASPLLAKDLEGLPSASILTAECDVITQQCVEYANKLCESGVEVHYKSFPGMLHDFITDENLEASGEAFKYIAAMAKNAVAAA